MKAITIWQPWASLIAIGAKQYEIRSWDTSYCGPIAIHAAFILTRKAMKEVFPLGEWSYSPDYTNKQALLRKLGDAFSDCAEIEDVEGYLSELPTGCVIATAELIACHKIELHGGRGASGTYPGWLETPEGIYYPSENEATFGNWSRGMYAWELANVCPLKAPIPAKGKQRIWEWDEQCEENAPTGAGSERYK